MGAKNNNELIHTAGIMVRCDAGKCKPPFSPETAVLQDNRTGMDLTDGAISTGEYYFPFP